MNYFQLTHIGANRRETGVSPQCTDSICIGDIQKIRVPSQGKIHDAFALPVPRLEKRARPSTMLSVVAVPTHFLVVKSHFIDFLEGFKVPGFQKWNIATIFFTSEVKVTIFPLVELCDFSKIHRFSLCTGTFIRYN